MHEYAEEIQVLKPQKLILIKILKSVQIGSGKASIASEVCQVQNHHILHLPFTFVPSNRIYFPFVVRGYCSDLGTRSNN
jgi:hypothetical protein